MNPILYGSSLNHLDAGWQDAEARYRGTGGNSGNLMFTHSIVRMTGADPRGIRWSSELGSLEADEKSILVMPLANQLGPHVDMAKLGEKIEKSSFPMIAMGLGAQGSIQGIDESAIPEGSWKWLETIVGKRPKDVPNITVRGAQTFDLLSRRGFGDAVVVAGCPSNFLNPTKTLGREIHRRWYWKPSRIAVAAGNPFLPQFAKLEQSLLRLASLDGTYVVQHPLDLYRLSQGEHDGIDLSRIEHHRAYLMPEKTTEDFLRNLKRVSRTFSSVPEWMNELRKYDLVVGTRIHGIMAGIQAGVPSICLYIDSRTKELCETMRIPSADANEYRDGFSIEDAEKILSSWDWRGFDEDRTHLAGVHSQFLEKNGIRPVGPVTEVAKKIPSSIRPLEKGTGWEVQQQIATATVRPRLEKFLPVLKRNMVGLPARIMSYGCGDGIELEILSKLFGESQILGVEANPVSLRIAASSNTQYPRVRVKHPSQVGDFSADLVVAISTLCQHPATSQVANASKIYPFELFAGAIESLAERMNPGALFFAYNTNYRVTDLEKYASLFEPVEESAFPTKQDVILFESSGDRAVSQEHEYVLHRRLG